MRLKMITTAFGLYIGNETPVESMKDCSVVTATYELQDGMKGTIGIIGRSVWIMKRLLIP